MTGGDYLSAEKKFKDFFSFQNTAKFIFSANVLPQTLDDTDAFFRRWLIITFPNKFEGERCDPTILKKLTTPEELSGFLNLVLDALKQLLRDDRFHRSKATAEIREEYIDKSNPVLSFVSKCLELDPGSFERKDDVYSAFIKFCRERKLPDTTKQRFGGLLPRYAQVREERKKIFGSRVQCWRGIRLVNVDEIKRDQNLQDQIDDSVIGDSREEYNQESERKDEQEYPLVDSSPKKSCESREETNGGREEEESLEYERSSFEKIKGEVLTYLTSIRTTTFDDLTDEVHKRTGYSKERVRECIERLIKCKWIEKDGRFVNCMIDCYPA